MLSGLADGGDFLGWRGDNLSCRNGGDARRSGSFALPGNGGGQRRAAPRSGFGRSRSRGGVIHAAANLAHEANGRVIFGEKTGNGLQGAGRQIIVCVQKGVLVGGRFESVSGLGGLNNLSGGDGFPASFELKDAIGSAEIFGREISSKTGKVALDLANEIQFLSFR